MVAKLGPSREARTTRLTKFAGRICGRGGERGGDIYRESGVVERERENERERGILGFYAEPNYR